MFQKFVRWNQQRLAAAARAAYDAGDLEKASELIGRANKWAAWLRR